MDNKEISEAENLELRISEMKTQFQKSYDVFIKAHEQLAKISFDSSTFTPSAGGLGALSQLDTKDIDEILSAGSIDACISALREKTNDDEHEPTENTFPEVSKLLSIMNGLQTDIESLTESQKHFTKLAEDVNQEMSLFEARMEDSINQLEDLVVESIDGSDTSQREEFTDGDEEEEESFGSEISDWIWIKIFLQRIFMFHFWLNNFQARNWTINWRIGFPRLI